MANPVDEVLVARALEGNDTAFAEIYSRYEPTLSRRLRRILVRVEDTEDVVQTTFMEAFRCLPRFRVEASLEAWLHGIAMNCAASYLRRQRRTWWQTTTHPWRIERLADGGAVGVDEQLIDQQSVERVLAAMTALPAKKRIAFALHDLEKMNLKEVGAIVGASDKTVWARVKSARRIIKKHLLRTGRGVRALSTNEETSS